MKVEENKKLKYKLSTGLWDVREQPLCSTDEEAWEYLRAKFGKKNSKYATLYRQEECVVPIVNGTTLIKGYNSKYTLQKINNAHSYKQTYWKPVLFGITTHKYSKVTGLKTK